MSAEATAARLGHVVVVADSDTRLKWAAAVAGGLRPQSVELWSLTDEAPLSERQWDELSVPVADRRQGSHADFAESAEWRRASVVVACTVGSGLARIRQAIEAEPETDGHRPLLVTGYCGVVYEKHLEGLMWRSNFDVICANSEVDRQAFASAFASLGLDPDRIVRRGLPIIPELPPVGAAWPPRRIVFAVQPDVPRTAPRRAWLLGRLADYAETHPDRTVIVKLRSLPSEVTTHPERHHYQALLGDRMPPPNLVFSYGVMAEVLATADLLVTVSSTAAFEAWARGVPVGILTDFGLAESLGNAHYVGSGALYDLDDLDADRAPGLDPSWLTAHGLGSADLGVRAESNLAEAVARRLGPTGATREPLPPRGPGAGDKPWIVERPDRRRRSADPARRVVRHLLSPRTRAAARRLRRWADA